MVYKHQITISTIHLLPSGYLLHSHGIDGPVIDGLPINNGDLPINNGYLMFI